jgi:hypothetical protein
MAEDTTQATEGTNDQTAAAAQSGERTFTQAELDAVVKERLRREREKYEGYVKADKATEALTRAEKAEAELQAMKAERERAQAVSKAAADSGIPAEVVAMLAGKDGEELAEQAKRIAELLPTFPTRIDDGGARAAAKKDNGEVFADFFNAKLKK